MFCTCSVDPSRSDPFFCFEKLSRASPRLSTPDLSARHGFDRVQNLTMTDHAFPSPLGIVPARLGERVPQADWTGQAVVDQQKSIKDPLYRGPPVTGGELRCRVGTKFDEKTARGPIFPGPNIVQAQKMYDRCPDQSPAFPGWSVCDPDQPWSRRFASQPITSTILF